MCRLLGIVTNKPGTYPSLLEKFTELFSTKNPDGWGIGWYENEIAHFFKEEIPAHDSASQMSRISKEVNSQLIIAHVRKLSEAPPSYENSHPFQVDNWLFIHNGAVDRDYLYSLLEPKYQQRIEGETDSEVYFYWVLQNIKNHNNDVIEGVKNAIPEVLTQRFTGINFLLSDGMTLYAFRYSQSPQDHYTLYKLTRNSVNPLDTVVLICSEPLTDEKWDAINYGHMLVVNKDLTIHEEKIV